MLKGLQLQDSLFDDDQRRTLSQELISARSRLILAAVADLVIWIACYLLVYKFDFDELWDRDATNYHVETSLLDSAFACIFRVVVIYAALYKTYSPGWMAQFCWAIFWIDLLAISKFMVFTKDHSDIGRTLLITFSPLINLVQLLLMKKLYNAYDKQLKEKKEEEVDPEDPLAGKKELSLLQLLKVLKPYFWPAGAGNRGRVVLTYVLLVLSKVSNIFGPLFIGAAAREIGKNYNTSIPWFNVGVYAALGFLSSAFKESQRVVYLKVGQIAYVELAQLTFSHLHKLSLEWHLKKKMGNILRAMDRGITSANTVVSYLFLYLVPSLAECIVVFVIFYAHFDQPWLAVIALLSVTLYVVLTIVITLWRKKFRTETNKHDNAYHDKATDSLINYETVKYFANEDFEIERYVSSVASFQLASVATQASLSLLNVMQQLSISLCLFGSMVVCGYEVVHKRMDLGDFVAVQVYVLNLFTPLSFLGTIYNMIIQAFVDMSNLSMLLCEEPDIVDKEDAFPLKVNGGKIEFKNVSFHYPTQHDSKGLQNISFTIEPNTTTAVVGTTGAGKTTIGRLLFRFYDVMSGQILIDGQDIAQVTQKSLRLNVGVVPQDTCMFNESIEFNVKYGRLDATKEEMRAACQAAQILGFIEDLEKGWDTMVGERGLRLSGGEKQRVAIARALLKNPPIVLLDEATSALDTVTEKSVQQALDLLASVRTTLIIAHRLSTIRHADQIIVLNEGKIAEKGTHAELIAQRGIYYGMWQTQSEEAENPKEKKKAAAEEEKKKADAETEKKKAAVSGHGHGGGHGHGHGGR